eukprot:9501108-Pyramimonas_sp.AAC.1
MQPFFLGATAGALMRVIGAVNQDDTTKGNSKQPKLVVKRKVRTEDCCCRKAYGQNGTTLQTLGVNPIYQCAFQKQRLSPKATMMSCARVETVEVPAFSTVFDALARVRKDNRLAFGWISRTGIIRERSERACIGSRRNWLATYKTHAPTNQAPKSTTPEPAQWDPPDTLVGAGAVRGLTTLGWASPVAYYSQ